MFGWLFPKSLYSILMWYRYRYGLWQEGSPDNYEGRTIWLAHMNFM